MKKLSSSLFLFLALVSLSQYAAFAQINMPAASPAATVTQRVGLTDISVSYSRPSIKGRKMFGETLPYGTPWRAGANSSTIVKFSDDVTVEGKKVSKGEYALYAIPAATEWTLVLNKNLKLGGNTQDYKETDDVARFKVKPTQTATKTETYTINFTDLTPATANMELLWENTAVKFKIMAEVDSKVMAQIQEKVISAQNATPDLYAAAALYYFENNKDPKMALEWMKKANEKDPKFWNMHTQAKIQAKNKDYKGAIASAEKSMALAKEAKNQDYVRMNETAIADWKKAK